LNDHDASPKPFFRRLWPDNSRPDNLALRSIYELYRQSIAPPSSDPAVEFDSLCQFSRELTNARRLMSQPSQLQTLVRQAADILQKVAHRIQEVCESLGNLMLVLNRFTSQTSVKSLCILTENYAALQAYDDLRHFGAIFGSDGDTLFNLFCTSQGPDVLYKLSDKLHPTPFKATHFFARDFHSPASEISRNGVRDIISLLTSGNPPPVIIGNNPMTDSLLDVLNLSGSGHQALLALDGFSIEVTIPAGFFVVVLVDKEDLTDPNDPFPLPSLDRLETVALNWDLIRFVVLARWIVENEFAKQLVGEMLNSPGKTLRVVLGEVDDLIQSLLQLHCKPDLEDPERFQHANASVLHYTLQELLAHYTSHKRDHSVFGYPILDELIDHKWENGLRCVIVTRANSQDPISLNFSSQNIEDEAISDAVQFRKSLEDMLNDPSKCVLLIKCRSFSKQHDQHLKYLIDSSKLNRTLHIVIIDRVSHPPMSISGSRKFREILLV
jgi:hypothetical protein